MREWKIQVWGITKDGDGFVQDLGLYENFEDIHLHTNMFKDTVIEFEQVFDEKDNK